MPRKKKDVTEEVVKKMTGLMSNREYLSHDGLQCPRCQNPDFTLDPEGEDEDARGKVQFSDQARRAERVINCEACGFRFLDVYRLAGYKEIE